MPLKPGPHFVRQYLALQPQIRDKVKKAIRLLDSNFRHPGLRSHPVQGHENVCEAYVDDKYRMTFERKGNLLILRNVDNHDECLRNP